MQHLGSSPFISSLTARPTFASIKNDFSELTDQERETIEGQFNTLASANNPKGDITLSFEKKTKQFKTRPGAAAPLAVPIRVGYNLKLNSSGGKESQPILKHIESGLEQWLRCKQFRLQASTTINHGDEFTWFA